MLRKYTSLVLTALLLSTIVCVRSANADSKEVKQAQLTEKVKVGISKLGVGKDARVEIKLRDKTEVKGYVYQAGEDNFVVRNPKTGSDTTVAYRDVTAVKGGGFSKGAKIGIAVGIAAAAVLISAAIALRNCCGINFGK
jgi:hypothetical protein